MPRLTRFYGIPCNECMRDQYFTTAEGIETAEQLAQVRAEGCTEVQGYLFSAPRPAAELAEFMGFGRPAVSAVA